MSEKEKVLRECAAQLRRLASELEEADDLTPDEVTCPPGLGASDQPGGEGPARPGREAGEGLSMVKVLVLVRKSGSRSLGRPGQIPEGWEPGLLPGHDR